MRSDIIWDMGKPDKNIAIDWEWVETHVHTRERFESTKDSVVKKALLEHAAMALKMAELMAAPRVIMAHKKILGFQPAAVEIQGGVSFTGKEFSAYLKGASHIYAFVATIGDGIEKAATAQMNGGDPLLGYLLDRIGSFAVESLAENAEKAIRRAIEPDGFGLSMRLSPGYCDWPLEEQAKLARIVDFSKAGISLNEHCVMTPKKSVSAIAGVGHKKRFSGKRSQCLVCSIKSCDYRRTS